LLKRTGITNCPVQWTYTLRRGLSEFIKSHPWATLLLVGTCIAIPDVS
jgi:hypothetical protein